MAAGLFSANDGDDGIEVWITDGRPEGTRLLADLWPGGGSGNPANLTPLGDGRVVLSATDPDAGNEPWVSDGTVEGTRRIADLNPTQLGFDSSAPGGFLAFGDGRLFFSADDGTTGREPWVTDGTAAGTRLVEDLFPGHDGVGNNGSFPAGVAALGDGRLLLAAFTPETGQELWVTDGAAGGTRLVRDIVPGSNGISPGTAPAGAVSLGDGRAVLSIFEPEAGDEPWVSDGTAEGTRRLADINPGPDSSRAFGYTALGDGRVLFSAFDPGHGTELWVTDGTPGGTALLADISPGPASGTPLASSPGRAAVVGGRTVFAANDGERGNELWLSDGTAEGTRLLADLWPGGGSGNPNGFAVLGDGQVVFAAMDPVHGVELWATDLTEAGTRLLADINPNQRGFASSGPANLVALGDGQVGFTADDGAHGREPWITDGTEAGTRLLADVNPGMAGSNPGPLVPVSTPAVTPDQVWA